MPRRDAVRDKLHRADKTTDSGIADGAESWQQHLPGSSETGTQQIPSSQADDLIARALFANERWRMGERGRLFPKAPQSASL